MEALKSKNDEEIELELSEDQTMLLNKELFAIDLTSMNDLNRFITFEVTNFQTIMDLAQQLQGQIANQSPKLEPNLKSVNEDLKQLESLLNP